MTTVSDHQAIRDLVDGWAHFADRRLRQQQAGLFTPDGKVAVYAGDPGSTEPMQVIEGHAALAKSFEILQTYDVTTHFNGQSTINVDGDTATGESYCLAQHMWTENGQRVLLVLSIRYVDTFVRHDSEWRFSDRKLVIDWSDKRPSSES
ncbi:nuclear transport factor 2 family protein [Arthrobacter sp. NPDC056727]|uniref:nuclear transport factor 2 family protein n=1 Tax=Arthrobacter sp. NPDC056727 TaxID=3345927 RepID=UPI00366B91AB